MRQLLIYTKNYKKELILGPFFKLLEAIFELLLPLYMAKLIDQGIKANNLTMIFQTSLKMVVMTVVGLICVMICQYYASIASQGFGTELRQTLFKKINTLSFEQLDLFGSDTLVTRMTSDVNQLQTALAMLIRLVIRAPFLSIGSVVMAFYIHPTTALIFLITLPLFFFILVYLMKKTVPLYKKVQKKTDELTRTIQENLTGIRVIRAFAQQVKQTKKIENVSDNLADTNLAAVKISALLNPLTTLILNLAILFLLYFSGKSVNIGSLEQGEVVALVNYLMQMLLALIVVSNLVVIFTKANTSATRVNEVLALPTDESVETATVINESSNKQQLVVSNLFFSYPNQNGWTLEDINFKITQGKTLGIIGGTGSGKSSLIQLFPRFYEWQKGEISLFGTSIRQLPIKELRQTIRIVPQKSVLISGTIRSNLKWGKSNASDSDMWLALELAEAKDFVSNLPKQLDSPVSEQGDNFSGGQKQRLAIARALINQPDVLILDDSLSALDYQTDLNLRQNLTKHLPKTTLIIITQRINSIRNADNIIVLDAGKVVASGTHDELVRHSPIYQQIASSQEQLTESEDI